MTGKTKSVGILSLGALACLIGLFAVLELRSRSMLVDGPAVGLAAAAIVGVAVFTVWAGLRALRRTEGDRR